MKWLAVVACVACAGFVAACVRFLWLTSSLEARQFFAGVGVLGGVFAAFAIGSALWLRGGSGRG